MNAKDLVNKRVSEVQLYLREKYPDTSPLQICNDLRIHSDHLNAGCKFAKTPFRIPIFNDFPLTFKSKVSRWIEIAAFRKLHLISQGRDFENDFSFVRFLDRLQGAIRDESSLIRLMISKCIIKTSEDAEFMKLLAHEKEGRIFSHNGDEITIESSIDSFAKSTFCSYNRTTDLAEQILLLTLDKLD